MEQGVRFSQFKEFDDLVRLVAGSPVPFLQYIEKDGKHIYFVYVLSFGRGSMVYFVELDEPIGKKYVVYNRFQDRITFSDRLETAGQTVSIPVLELARTNTLEEYPFE